MGARHVPAGHPRCGGGPAGLILIRALAWYLLYISSMREKVYGYIRVSGLGQKDGDGPERQKVAIVQFCQQHNLDLLNIYQEVVSGTKHASDRPAFTQMVVDAETNGVTGVVLESVTRLARELLVQEVIVSKLADEAHLHVYTTDRGLEDIADENADPTRVLIRQVLGALAQWDRAEITRKLAYARQRKRVQTGRCEGAKPYGHFPKEAKIVAVIKNSIEAGFTLEATCKLLNDADVKTRFGRRWTRGNIHPIVDRIFPNYNKSYKAIRRRAERFGRMSLEEL